MDQKKELSANQLTLAINDLIENIQDTFKKIMRQNSEHLHLAVNDLLEAWLEFTRRMLPDVDKLAHAQLMYWQDYLLLCKDLNQRLSDSAAAGDHYVGAQNKEGILLAFIEKFSFLVSQHVQVVLKQIFSANGEDDSKKIEFYTRQFTEAFAQHNFINTYKVLYMNLSAGKEIVG